MGLMRKKKAKLLVYIMGSDNKKYRNAIGYLRVSSKEQGKGTSLETQIEGIKNLCLSKGILLIETFVDKYSGKNFNRPEFKRALKFLSQHKGEIDLFLSKRIDRFTRDTKTALLAIEKIESLGAEVNYVDDWMDDINSPQGRMVSTIKMAVSEYERALINERSRLGMRQAMIGGRYIYTPPLGYNMGNLSNGKKGLIPNELSSTIKDLFTDYSRGIYSQIQLVQKYKHRGLNISKSSISRILDNVLYMGHIDLEKYKISPYKIIKGVHQGIITPDLFYQVQKLKDDRNRMKKKIRPKNEDFPLSAHLICSNCGSPIYGSKSNNGKSKKVTRSYSYYRCSKNCSNQSYKPEIIHRALERELAKVKPSNNVTALFKVILERDYEKKSIQRMEVVKSIERKIKDNEEDQVNLTLKYSSGKIPEQLFEKTLQKLNDELRQLNIERTNYSDYHDDLKKYIEFGVKLLLNLDIVYSKSPVEVKTQLLGSYFSKKLIFENKKFRTLPFNDAILLISKYNKGLEALKKEKGDDFATISREVPGVGLEPTRTLLPTGF